MTTHTSRSAPRASASGSRPSAGTHPSAGTATRVPDGTAKTATKSAAAARSGDPIGTARSTAPGGSARANQTSRASTSASGSSLAAPREKLSAVQNLPERFCVHCRGPHDRRRHVVRKMSVAERAAANDRGLSEFGRLYNASELPAEKNSGSFGGADALRWKRPGWPEEDFDVETWLPIFLGGARETAEPQRMIAIQGSKRMMRQPSARILPLIPVLVPPLRACLSTTNPPAVAAALDLVRFLLTQHEEAVDVLIACDGFRRMLPAPNLLATCKVRVRTGYDLKMIGGQQQRLDLLIDEVLELMATKGGERGLRLIKSYIPTFVWPKPPGAKPRR